MYKWVCKWLKCKRRLAYVSNEHHGLNRNDHFGSLNFFLVCTPEYTLK